MMDHATHTPPGHIAPPRPSRRAGFTLIELSIVLVIVGLIIGGILVGRELIQAARIRAQITQIEKYNTEVHTFQIKYNAIPGDMQISQAAQVGFFNTGMDGSRGKGDGNGLIETTAFPYPHPYLIGEPYVFWRHLSDANLIDGSFGANLNPGGDLNISPVPYSQVSQWLPPAKVGGGNFLVVYASNGYNYFELLAFGNPPLIIGGGYAYSASGGLTPIEANAIDTKLDDGKPLSGRVQEVTHDNNYYLGDPPASGDTCNIGTPAIYDLGLANGSSGTCFLSFQFQ